MGRQRLVKLSNTEYIMLQKAREVIITHGTKHLPPEIRNITPYDTSLGSVAAKGAAYLIHLLRTQQ